MQTRRSKRCSSRCMAPDSIFETSSMSLMMDRSESVLLLMISTYSHSTGSNWASWRRPAMPMIAFIGVLI